jgi:3-hydroxyisobutyrate dehydrogenase-like beta-hydroxyacid dehydrogenase
MTESSDLRVAFCGLGRMGAQMATRIAAGGFPLAVWNRSPGAARSLADTTGATAAATPRDAARDADVVITMLTDGEAVLSVLDGPDGVLAGLRAGTLVVDCSTTGAELAGEAAELCARAGVSFLDCPVSGSTVVAGRGELGLMVGGDGADLDRARPVLATFGRTVVHVGPTGAGAAAKIAVNGLLHTFSTTLAESLVAAEAAGVARTALFDVLAAGVLSNTFLDYKRDAFVDPERSGVAFDLATASKDLGLALAASRAAGLGHTVVGRVLELHREAVADGFGDKDMAAMTTWLRERAGAAPDAATADPHQTLERT